MESLLMPTRGVLTGALRPYARTRRRDCTLHSRKSYQSGGALCQQGEDRVGGFRQGSHLPHVCKELLESFLSMHRPELKPGCCVAGVVQAFMEGPVLIQYQAEARSKVKEQMCSLPTTYLELSGLQPWVGMDPPRITSGHPYLWGSLLLGPAWGQ